MPPRLDAMVRIPEWGVEYRTRKQALMTACGMRVPRGGILSDSSLFEKYREYFELMATATGTLSSPVINCPTGVLHEVTEADRRPRNVAPAARTISALHSRPSRFPTNRSSPGLWTVHIDFFRFDGDTLVGRVNGWLRCSW